MNRCVYTFTAAYGMSFGPIGWVLPNEVFSLSMRSKGVSLSTASNWINNCASQLFPMLKGLSSHDTDKLSKVFIGLVTPSMMEFSSVYVSFSGMSFITVVLTPV